MEVSIMVVELYVCVKVPGNSDEFFTLVLVLFKQEADLTQQHEDMTKK